MISLRNVTVRQGEFALEDVSFDVPTGQYGVLMGKTGSGKTTILEIICGLRPIAAGEVWLGDENVTDFAPAERGIGYVPQDLSLFSTFTVRDHLAFAPTVHRWPAEQIDARVAELADLLGISPLLGRKPKGLSGGESQRVALGRALAIRPRVLLFDEPLSALDDDTRLEMYDLLRLVKNQMTVTVLHVTHNRGEADALADCRFQVRDGRIAPVTV